jgi:hypothetical protein
MPSASCAVAALGQPNERRGVRRHVHLGQDVSVLDL